MKLFLVLLVLATTTLTVHLSPVSAVAVPDGQTCAEQFDGTQLKVKNGKLVIPSAYTNSMCSKKGRCTVVTDHAGSVITGVISCTAAQPTAGGSSGSAGSGGVTDPATDAGVACTSTNCPIIKKYINPLIALLSALVGIVAVIAIILGAIQVSTSAGDPQKSAAGKNHIRNALIGLVAYALLWGFLQFVVIGGIN